MRGGSAFKEQAVKRGSRNVNESPMFKNRHFNEERRSRLFADRPFIWGRLPKYLIAWAFSMQFWAGYYLYHKHAVTRYYKSFALITLVTCKNKPGKLIEELCLLFKQWRMWGLSLFKKEITWFWKLSVISKTLNSLNYSDPDTIKKTSCKSFNPRLTW